MTCVYCMYNIYQMTSRTSEDICQKTYVRKGCELVAMTCIADADFRVTCSTLQHVPTRPRCVDSQTFVLMLKYQKFHVQLLSENYIQRPSYSVVYQP